MYLGQKMPVIYLRLVIFKDKINQNLYEHYKTFKFYAEPKLFT
jgi:hypothetical protein